MLEKVSLIIPAFNEEGQIANVLSVVIKSPLLSEIIVVDDGSKDNTAGVASKFPVRVIVLPKNQGKGGAMAAGMCASSGEIVLFLDADLIHLSQDHIKNLLAPFHKSSEVAMSLGIFRSHNIFVFFGQQLFPHLSGQRAIRKKYFPNATEDISGKGFAVETYLSRFVIKNHLKYIKVPLRDLGYVFKEEKSGFIEGFKYRAKMYYEIAGELLRDGRKKSARVKEDKHVGLFGSHKKKLIKESEDAWQ